MDDAAFRQLEQSVRTDLTPEQCIQIEKAAQETAAAHLLDTLISKKTIATYSERKCILCGAEAFIKNGRNENGL